MQLLLPQLGVVGTTHGHDLISPPLVLVAILMRLFSNGSPSRHLEMVFLREMLPVAFPWYYLGWFLVGCSTLALTGPS